MSKKLDPRIIRTRKLLQDALIALIKRKAYSDITVQDITDEATLNRSTFYMHYNDKDDLFQHIIVHIIENLQQITMPDAIAPELVQQIFISLFDHVRDHWDFYNVMLQNQSVAPFTRQMQEHIENLARQLLTNNTEPVAEMSIPPTLYASFASSAFLGVVKWWITEAPERTARQVALQFMKLALGGVADEFNLDLDALM